MAKKETAKKSVFSFGDVVASIQGIIKPTAIQHITHDEKRHREYISTGIYALNAALCGDIYGGIANNRITVFAGESGVGKSFLCYNICKEAQRQGYAIVYIDTEFSIELDQLPGYGIDTDPKKFMLLSNNIIEDLKITLTQLLDKLKEEKNNGKELPKMLFVLDSVGQLASRKEVEDAKSGSEKADFTKAKALASFFRILNADLSLLNIATLMTNHSYKTMDLFPQDKMKGGCLTEEAIIQTLGGLKLIKDISVGDYVKTIDGFEEVLETHTYDKEAIEFELEDGQKFTCSKTHQFLINEDYLNPLSWKTADELLENDIILSL